MTESLLLQETGSGYFTLETGTGRILLEISVPAEPAGGSSGGIRMDEDLLRLTLLRRDDEEIALLVAAIS